MEIDEIRKIEDPIFYVTNDVGRGIGLEGLLPNYHIVCLDDHPLVNILQEDGVSVFCLERVLKQKNALLRNAATILEQPAVLSFIKEKSLGKKANLLFFKPQRKMEILAAKHGFNLLGNPVAVNRLFEDKVAFFEQCRKRGIKVPRGEIKTLTDCRYEDLAAQYGEPMVIQFGRGWAGNSTFFIGSKGELEELVSRFGPLKVKVSQFISGKTILNNAAVFAGKVLVGPPALQIKAERELTATQGGTGGRQWPAPLSDGQEQLIKEITQEVGKLMIQEGYRGFFGLDFLVDREGEVYLSENNARLTASVPFFTKLELWKKVFPLLGYHLLAFLGDETARGEYPPPVIAGSEIVIRNNQDGPVMTRGSLKTGLYQENFEFIKEAGFLENDGSNNFWLEPVAPGRKINPEIEVAKIDTSALVAGEDGRLKDQYRQLVSWVKEKLVLERC